MYVDKTKGFKRFIKKTTKMSFKKIKRRLLNRKIKF